MKKVLITVLILLLTGVSVYAGINAPDYLKEREAKRYALSQTFDGETYAGWLLAYDSLSRAEDTLYNKAQTDQLSQDYYSKNNYPNRFFPEQLEEFGIAVQKDYSSNWLFYDQKAQLMNYLEGRISELKTANSLFKSVDAEPTAHDANVLKAIESYTLLFERMNSSLLELKPQEAKNVPIGEYLKKGINDQAISEPFVYSTVAKQYLSTNLVYYKGAWDEWLPKAELTKEQRELFKRVTKFYEQSEEYKAELAKNKQ